MPTFDDNLDFEELCKPYYDKLYKKLGFEVKRHNKKGSDLEAVHRGKSLIIEEKSRKGNWSDILVELVQDTKTNNVGWLYYCNADLIFYGMFGDTKEIYIILFSKFKDWVENWLDMCETVYSSDGWGNTKNKAVPIVWIPRKLIRRYEI